MFIHKLILATALIGFSNIASAATLSDCTANNGKLGDSAPAQVRDFCLSQTSNITTGMSHKVLPFAMEYYKAMKCTPETSVQQGNCQNAANTIANGTVHAFHLDHFTLAKIRNAVIPGTATNCPCQGMKGQNDNGAATTNAATPSNGH